MPKVSILVPVYNVEDYLDKCLRSIIAQTLTDIEIICVNDGSTDASADILERYSKKDDRIIVVKKENGGLPSARNAGLDVATGDFVGFVDSDDYIQPDMYEKLYNAARRDNSDIVICGANIFPIDPKPDNWLVDALSPRDVYFSEFTPDLIFKEHATRPFIWRTFIRRNLLEENHIRLNESIHIGEDNAFQFRVYPKAKGITIISDKLYNYRWYREGSLMNNVVYKDIVKKTRSHVQLVLHIAEEWEKTVNEKELMSKEFLQWSIEFIYNDFLKLPLKEKIDLGKKLTDVWTDYGYYTYRKNMDVKIQDMFKYIYESTMVEEFDVKLSMIIYVTGSPYFLKNTIDSITEQTMNDIEIIIVNSFSDSSAFDVIFNAIHNDKRIRLCNTDIMDEANALNYGISIASGKYLGFVKTNDYLLPDAAEMWCKTAEENDSDVCISLFEERDSLDYVPIKRNLSSIISKDEMDNYYLDSDFHNCIYKTEFVNKNKLMFANLSILTGRLFIAKSYKIADKKSLLSQVVYINRVQYKKDWIPTEECFLVLDGIVALLKLSLESNDSMLHAKTYSLICGDLLTQMIINNTLAFWSYDETFPNGENSQAKAWSNLVKAMGLIDYEMLSKIAGNDKNITYPIIMQLFVEKRHQFLAELNNKYKQLSMK